MNHDHAAPSTAPGPVDTLLSMEFMPHGHCYQWDPLILGLNVVSDGVIAIAYFSIPVALMVLVRRRRDLVVPGIFALFGAFILLCGATHVVAIGMVWKAGYGVQGLVKTATAIVSIGTAGATWMALPRVLALPSADSLRDSIRSLEDANLRLEAQAAELKAANDAVVAGAERARRLLAALPLGLITVDRGGVVADANPAARAMLGIDPDAPLGAVHELLPPDLQDPDGSLIQELTGGASTPGTPREVRGRTRAGADFTTEVTLVPLEQGQVLACLRDLSDRRAAEVEQARREQLEKLNAELARSNAELDSFAYVASHDLRSPLRAIENLASWVAEDAADVLPEESKENLALLRSRVTRLDRLLSDLLTYSRAGRVLGPPEEVPLDEVFEEVVALLAPPAGFEVVRDAPLPSVHGPRTPLEQILLNLVSNALKHHDRDTGTVRVSATETGDRVTLTVTDDGPGIEAAYHELVFEMFKTLQPRDAVEGSGMGLAVVRRIVDAAGGSIELESEGRGATFRCILPKRWGAES